MDNYERETMSLVPEFELGLWNAWILALLMFIIIMGLSPLVIRLFFGRSKSKESSKRHSARPKLSEREKKLDHLSTVTLLALLGYSVVLPLDLGTGWFYAGLFVYVISILFGFTAMINFAQDPLDNPATKGVYTISRNPMYFSMFLIFVGLSLACASWLFLLLTMVWLILVDRGVVAEERLCLETYGDSYRKYMNRTPRWIGIPKSEKRD
jgi:protein-S-isoprenylcysteine O-methyltransferase Ste14